jgi:hypothetical protein
MKAVRNLFLMCALVVIASSSFAQEVKGVKYNPETNKLIEQRNQQPQKHPKQKKMRSDLQHSKAKPIKIESRIYNESN